MSRILIAIINVYRNYIGYWIPPVCKFTPSCSMYMIEAIQKYGVVCGVIKGIWRILRCNPWSKGGYDPP
ncbi:MAG: membrane protein insertion efficiency factor YidD [Planctomycetaceae bacterium]|nr:membrane protein insertion efficiency factor YidD [Planctomycetaceae bacterium]